GAWSRPPRSPGDLPGLLLLPGVGQVVEVNLLPVAIDPGGDDPETVKACAGFPVPLLQVQPDRLPAQPDGDLPPSSRAGGGILQGPGVGGAVGVDVGGALPGGVSLAVPVDAVSRRKIKPLPAGSADRHAEEV